MAAAVFSISRNSRPDYLNKEYSLRITLYEKAVPVLLNIIFCTVKYVIINEFNSCRIMIQGKDICPDSILKA